MQTLPLISPRVPTRVAKQLIRAAPGIGARNVLEELRGWIIALVVGVILLFAGAAGASITASVVAYIIHALNSTGIIKASYNYVDQVTGIVGPIFTIIGVVLIVVAAVFIIRKILEIPRELGE